MRTCPNCQNSVPDGAYCPTCGYMFPDFAGASRSKVKRRRVRALLAVFFAAAALCLFIFLPRPGFESIQRSQLLDPALKLLGGAADRGELSADLELTAGCDDFLISRLLRGSAAVLKLQLEDGGALINAGLTVMGSEVLTGYATYRDGALGFALPQADGKYYEGAKLPLPKPDASSFREKTRACLDILFDAVNDENLTVTKENGLTRYVFAPSEAELEAMVLALGDELGIGLVPPESLTWTLEASWIRLKAVTVEAGGVTVRIEPDGLSLPGTVTGPGFDASFELNGELPLSASLTLDGDPLGVGIDGLTLDLTATTPSTAKEPEGELVDISGYNILEVIKLAEGLVSKLTGDILGEFGGIF